MYDGFIIIYLFIGIVYLILTISMIVKFFQIAKDLNFLKQKGEFEYDSFNFLIANGYKDEAKRVVLRKVWNDYWMQFLRDSENNKQFDTHYNKLKDRYIEEFKMLQEEFPKYDNLRPKE